MNESRGPPYQTSKFYRTQSVCFVCTYPWLCVYKKKPHRRVTGFRKRCVRMYVCNIQANQKNHDICAYHIHVLGWAKYKHQRTFVHEHVRASLPGYVAAIITCAHRPSHVRYSSWICQPCRHKAYRKGSTAPAQHIINTHVMSMLGICVHICKHTWGINKAERVCCQKSKKQYFTPPSLPLR